MVSRKVPVSVEEANEVLAQVSDMEWATYQERALRITAQKNREGEADGRDDKRMQALIDLLVPKKTRAARKSAVPV